MRASVLCGWMVAASVALGCGGGKTGDSGETGAGGSGSSGGGGKTSGADGGGTAADGSGGGTGAGDGTGGADATGGGDAADGGTGSATDGGSSSMCRPTPVRMIVLGDSITACSVVGGPDSPDCISNILHQHFADTYGDLSYENVAVGGAITQDVVDNQLGTVQTGMPGHALVMIYIGGNDLAGFLLSSDQQAVDGYAMLAPQLADDWDQIYAFFDDPANFPDGVSMLMNTQYDPFDGCTAAPYFVSQTKLGLLGDYNDAMLARADEHDWVFIADQYPSFLGHGNHYSVMMCPHYDASFEGWMADTIHANPTGNQHLAGVLADTAAQMYADCP